ncbi:protein kinase domain-containing protein [Allorhodopirellula solitaria]|uniref:Serine/threonine-protein kinase PknD n=1 Tax=Allorhodopirellula solitaria TaxID=2527987 RepID=A0A5C5YK28_9BACT|nr:protein kinase [Allorhodopirellula solitaria]TWT75179.1 Serine/threonine-protein kinase PknD [Allorhodopirellula solitaria]
MATLLDTISDDESLAQRLAAMPSDCKTLTLSFADHGLDLHHPNWSADASDEQCLQQTIDTPADFASLRSDEGFVPGRNVVSWGLASSDHKDSKAPVVNSDEAEYRLIGKLGSGGTGIVYQAHQRAIDREVAVKVLRHELASDRQSRQRFLTEARVIGSLDHPNVIALHDLCIDGEGHLFYAMKRIDGASWDQQISQFSVEENLTILLRVADAIRYAHSRALVHRDIKPENVMLGRFGEALVADWGLALQLSGKSQGAIASAVPDSNSAIGGTPAYMAPEQAIGQLESITILTDVYLLGAILYQILTGRPPHRGKNLLQCIQAAAHNDIPSTDVVGELMDTAMRAMESDPAKRFPNVEEFIRSIKDHRTHEESERLVRRSRRRVWPDDEASGKRDDSAEGTYERFRVGQALLYEAIELWPENARAKRTLEQIQLEFARFAAAQGDLDLSLRLYDASGQGDCEAAVRVRRERDQRDRMRESQAKYSALFTQSPEAGLLVRWSDGIVLEANLACLTLLGYQVGDLVGRSMSDLEVWASSQRREQFLDTITRDGGIENFETQFLRNSELADRKIDVLISARTVNVNGVEMLMSTIRDISERRGVERNLEQSRRRLRDLQRLAGLGAWSFEPGTDSVHWSEETFRVVGRDRRKSEPNYEELMANMHPDDREPFREVIETTLQTGTSFQLHFRFRDDDGNYRSLLTRGRPVVDDDGDITEVYGILMPGKSC